MTVYELLVEIKNHVLALDRKVDRLMSVATDIKDLLAKIDAATNAVAAKLTAALAGVKNSMTDAEVADVKTTIQGEIDKLTAMGADPANPVPVQGKKP